jgi:hypothetical protein
MQNSSTEHIIAFSPLGAQDVNKLVCTVVDALATTGRLDCVALTARQDKFRAQKWQKLGGINVIDQGLPHRVENKAFEFSKIFLHTWRW